MNIRTIINWIKESSILSQVIAGLILAFILSGASFAFKHAISNERSDVEKSDDVRTSHQSDNKPIIVTKPSQSVLIHYDKAPVIQSENVISAKRPQERDDYDMRKKAIFVFDKTFGIIRTYVNNISKLKQYEDYVTTNTGYGIRENPLRKGHQYGLANRYYNDIRYWPLNEVIVENYQYIFKLDGAEYYRASIMKSVDLEELEAIIKEKYTNYFERNIITQ